MEKKTNKQAESKEEKTARIQPYQWKKGQSGNPSGRKKGKTMKEYARALLECQTEEERQEFMNGLSKEIIWKMAEGNPKQDNTTEHKMDGSLIGLIKGNNEPETPD